MCSRSLGLFLFVFWMISSPCRAAEPSLLNHAELTDFRVEFEDPDFLMLRDAEAEKTVSVHETNIRFATERPSPEEIMNQRVQFYDLFGLKRAEALQSQKQKSKMIILSRMEFENQTFFVVEEWSETQDGTRITTRTMSELQEARQIYEKIRSPNQASFGIPDFLPRAEAVEAKPGATCSVGPFGFKGQIDSLLAAVEDKISVPCELDKNAKGIEANPAYASVKACLKGIATTPTELVKFGYNIIKALASMIVDPAFRASVLSGAGATLTSLVRDPSGFISKTFNDIWESAAKEVKNFASCSVAYKAQVTCHILTDIMSGTWVFKKLVSKLSSRKAVQAATRETPRTRQLAKKSDPSPSKKPEPDRSPDSAPPGPELREHVADALTEGTERRGRFFDETAERYARRVDVMEKSEAQKKLLQREIERLNDEVFQKFGASDILDLPDDVRNLHAKRVDDLRLKIVQEEDRFAAAEKAALKEMREGLRRNGIEFYDNSRFRGQGENPYRQVAEYVQDQAAVVKLEARLKELEADPKLPSVFVENQLDLIQKRRQAIAEFEARLAGDSTLNEIFSDLKPVLDQAQTRADYMRVIAQIDELDRPHLEIRKMPGSHVVEQVRNKLDARIVVSPSAEARRARDWSGMYSGEKIPLIKMNGANLLDEVNGRAPVTLLHEARHAFLAKQRRRGLETPYNIRLAPDRREPGLSVSGYSRGFSLEELSTHERDTRLYRQKKISQTAKLSRLNQLIREADTGLNAIVPVLKDESSDVMVIRKKKQYDVVVPYQDVRGKRSATITMLGDAPPTTAEARERVLQYVERSQAAVKQHQTAQKELERQVAAKPKRTMSLESFARLLDDDSFFGEVLRRAKEK